MRNEDKREVADFAVANNTMYNKNPRIKAVRMTKTIRTAIHADN